MSGLAGCYHFPLFLYFFICLFMTTRNPTDLKDVAKLARQLSRPVAG